MFQLAKIEGSYYAKKAGKLYGRVYFNCHEGLTDQQMMEVYGGWSDLISVAENPPNGLFRKPTAVFSNWYDYEELTLVSTIAISQDPVDIEDFNTLDKFDPIKGCFEISM